MIYRRVYCSIHTPHIGAILARNVLEKKKDLRLEASEFNME